jgi:hypothetical protein
VTTTAFETAARSRAESFVANARRLFAGLVALGVGLIAAAFLGPESAMAVLFVAGVSLLIAAVGGVRPSALRGPAALGGDETAGRAWKKPSGTADMLRRQHGSMASLVGIETADGQSETTTTLSLRLGSFNGDGCDVRIFGAIHQDKAWTIVVPHKPDGTVGAPISARVHKRHR